MLIGKETFQRHWVDYEVFRSIELGKGVFGVFINGLKDRNGYTDPRGANPFQYLGYGTSNHHPGKLVPYAQYKSGWKIYEDASPVAASAAAYLQPNSKPVLSNLFRVYDWIGDRGYDNFSTWVQTAARQAQR